MTTHDVIIIGGGFLGVSAAYEAAKAGLRVLLLEAGDLGSGTSGSCSGRAQVCEGHLDPLNIALVRGGVERHEHLAEELGYDYNITLEERHTPAEKKRWPCLCGAKRCRRTLLAKKR